MAKQGSAEQTVREIRRRTRRKFSSEEKIRIVLEGLRGDETRAHERVAGESRLAHTRRMAKKPHRTGRVSRRKARAVAKILHAELASGKLGSVSGSTVTRKKTASGSGSISFHIVSSKTR